MLIDIFTPRNLHQTFTAVNTRKSEKAIGLEQFTDKTFAAANIENLAFEPILRTQLLDEKCADFRWEAG